MKIEKHNVVKYIRTKNVKTFTKREIVKELNKFYKDKYWTYYYIESILLELIKENYLKATYFSEQRPHGSVTIALYEVK